MKIITEGKMKQKAILVIALLALVLLMIAPVSAETLTGTLGSGGTNFLNFNVPKYSTGTDPFSALSAHNIENSVGLISVVLTATPDSGLFLYSNATAVGNTTLFQASIGGVVVGNGTLGISRSFSGAPPVENYGYVYVVFSDYNPGSFTGDQVISLTYDYDAVYNPRLVGYNISPTDFDGVCIGGTGITYAGDVIQAYSVDTYAEYTATKPMGLGITGIVSKLHSGTIYNSQAFVVNASNINQIYASNYAVGTTDLIYNVPAQSIIIGIKSPYGVWFNSSVLFSVVTPTPTPTVTPTPTTTIPAGYIRSYVQVEDQNGAVINGATIAIKDVETGLWANSTNDPDGFHYIDTLPYHTMNIYGSYTVQSNVYADNSELGVSTGYVGTSTFLRLYPYSAGTAGVVRLYVQVQDSNTHYSIPDASVSISTISGATLAGMAGSSGIATFDVVNDTLYTISATSPGYLGATLAINSGNTATKYQSVYLTRVTVTPTITGTVIPGEITVRPTVDPNDPVLHGGDTSFKAQEMMNYLAMNGMSLVQICLLVTILALFGVKLGKR